MTNFVCCKSGTDQLTGSGVREVWEAARAALVIQYDSMMTHTMTDRLLLTQREIIEVTGYRRRQSQARWCLENGIEFRYRRDGSLVVAREHFLNALGVSRDSATSNNVEPDFSSLL